MHYRPRISCTGTCFPICTLNCRLFVDTYDVVLCVGAHSTSHIGYSTYEPLAAITKPGNLARLLMPTSSVQELLIWSIS